MNLEFAVDDRDTLAWWLQQIGVSPARFAIERPDYLIISPPKTGSTWLAENLRRHPEVFVPSIKEIKYFSSFFKSLDLNWYLDQLAPGAGRVKGEASPSYALLPVERIKLVRWLMPQVKIIFLMRDPIERAWSHAKHNFRYGEANFRGSSGELDRVADQQWLDNFHQDWTLAGGDYLGQLRRWLSVFPREQFFLGYFESIVEGPEALLRDVLHFLGVRSDVDLEQFPVREKVLPGPPGQLSPGLRRSLHRLLRPRTAELACFLREQGECPPPEWPTLLPAADEQPASACTVPVPFARAGDDRYLAAILAEEEKFPSAWCPVLGDHRGFNLISSGGQVYALDVNLGNVQPAEIGEANLERYQKEQRCFVGATLANVKAGIDRHLFEKTEARLAELPRLRAELEDTQARLTRLECTVAQNVCELKCVEADRRLLRPWIWLTVHLLRPVWRVLRAPVRMARALQPGRSGQTQASDSTAVRVVSARVVIDRAAVRGGRENEAEFAAMERQ